MKILIGDTGLVGTTLKEKNTFDLTFNSKNINTLNDLNCSDSVVYLSCLPATKWMVNKDIKKDIDNINHIIEILSKISFKQIILISTIDVYCDSAILSNEDSHVQIKKLSYGTNRYFFELLVRSVLKYDDLKIFRLPALFNKHIKKNILFDLINNNNINQINKNSCFQWYNLDELHDDINSYITKYPDETLFNLFTEPIETSDIVDLFAAHKDNVGFSNSRIEYNYTTKFGSGGYIKTKEIVLEEIKKYVNDTISK